MVSFVLITISILSIMYLFRLIKCKFRNQKNDFIRNIQIALYVATFLPLLTVGLLAFLDNRMIAISTIVIYLIIYLFYIVYILYKKHRIEDFVYKSGNVTYGTRGSDDNDSIYMKDGDVILNDSTNDGNGSLDYDGNFEMSGGTLIAAGSLEMSQAPSSESMENSIKVTIGTQSANTVVCIESEGGEEIGSATNFRSCN